MTVSEKISIPRCSDKPTSYFKCITCSHNATLLTSDNPLSFKDLCDHTCHIRPRDPKPKRNPSFAISKFKTDPAAIEVAKKVIKVSEGDKEGRTREDLGEMGICWKCGVCEVTLDFESAVRLSRHPVVAAFVLCVLRL